MAEKYENSGGVVRIQHIPEGMAEENNDAAPRSLGHPDPGGLYRVNGMDLNVQRTGVQRIDAGDLAASTDPLDNGRSPSGRPQSRYELTLDSRVTYRGMEGRVREMVTMGLLAPNPAGGFQWASDAHGRQPQSAQQSRQQPTQQQDVPENEQEPPPAVVEEKLSDDTEAFIKVAVTKLGDNLPPAIAETIITGGDPESYVSDVAQRMGLEPEAVRGRLSSIREEFTEQARRASGFDAETYEQFSEWALSSPERRVEAEEAMRRQVLFGDLKPLKKLAQEFGSTGQQWDDESVLNAEFGRGITASRDTRTGKVILSIHGQTMPFTEAVRLDLLKVTQVARK